MAENVECMKRTGTPTGVFCRNLKETDHLEDLNVDGKIICKKSKN
jgi:hypothetical protein